MQSEKSLGELADANVVIEIITPASLALSGNQHSMSLLEGAIRTSYKALAGTTDVQFEPIAVVQELQERCTTSWLKTSIGVSAADVAASQSEEAFLRFLDKGTLALLGWLNTSSNPSLLDLQLALKVLVFGEVMKTTAQPFLPKSSALVEAVAAWQQAKDALRSGEKARILFETGSAELDLTKKISDPLTLLATTYARNNSVEMILIVEMPDYTGTGTWQVRHGQKSMLVGVNRKSALDAFYRRDLDVRPGDALRCRVNLEARYGDDFELISERLEIAEVAEVLRVTSTDRQDAQKGEKSDLESAEVPQGAQELAAL